MNLPLTPADLLSLASRLEMASGPDRALDIALGRLLFDRKRLWKNSSIWMFRKPNGFSGPVPEWTYSVDAILALLEEKLPGWSATITTPAGPDPRASAQLHQWADLGYGSEGWLEPPSGLPPLRRHGNSTGCVLGSLRSNLTTCLSPGEQHDQVAPD